MAQGTKTRIIIEVAEALQRKFPPGSIVAIVDAERATDRIAPDLPTHVRYVISRSALEQSFVPSNDFVMRDGNWDPGRRYVRDHKVSAYGREN